MISPYVFPGVKELSEVRFSAKYRKEKITPKQIMEIVASRCGVTIEDIISTSRKGMVVEARHIYCGIMKNYCGYTYDNIGETIGRRDHTTALHSVRVFNNRCELEEDFREAVDSILYDLQKNIN